MARQTIRPDRPHAIVCEGRDAENYLIWMLRALIVDDDVFDLFQVIDAGGIDDLSKYIAAMPKLSNFSAIRTLTIVRDAETNAVGSDQSARSLLKRCRFAAPASACSPCHPCGDERNVITGYALFPCFDREVENGAIEDLCLKTLTEKNAEEKLCIVDDAISRVERTSGKLKWINKSRLHTYLSLSDKFVTLKLGESARAGAYDFHASALEPFKNFLRSMVDAAEHGLNGRLRPTGSESA
ncbi:MAG: hypothetical protein LBI62_10145 [Candidatus Accumulibacter sp.]|jgi:hypothetical protein|nr:hypothetical protein [Accumulibacter sp.]